MKSPFLPLMVIGMLGAGCNPSITKQEFAPQMYVQPPKSILVLPAINRSSAADAKEYYATTVAEPLTNSGYYVLPMEVVNDVLKQEGLFDTETMFNVPPMKYREFFGVDAVMYVTILSWDTVYLLTSGSVTVHIAAELKSTSTGDTIWFYDDEVSVDTSGDTGGASGLAGILVQAATTAIKTAATSYIPLARKVNEQIFLAIPYGHYHEDFDKDRLNKIEKKKTQTATSHTK